MSLSMSRKRDRKVFITDEAIKKVPKLEYVGIESCNYELIQSMAKEVLRISKNENKSNEVSIIFPLNNAILLDGNTEGLIGISLGTEHSVNPEENVVAYHLLRTTFDCILVCSHNHPNLSKISIEDVAFFLKNANLKMMLVVTNLGAISYMVKTSTFNWNNAVNLYNEAVTLSNNAKNLKGLQLAAKYFLNNCKYVGIYYK